MERQFKLDLKPRDGATCDGDGYINVEETHWHQSAGNNQSTDNFGQ
jgi:hypothetical protein